MGDGIGNTTVLQTQTQHTQKYCNWHTNDPRGCAHPTPPPHLKLQQRGSQRVFRDQQILQGNYRHPGTLSHHHQSPSGCCPALTTDILAKLPSPRDSLFQRYSSQPEGQRDTRHHTKASEKCLESWENEPTISKQKRRQLSGQNRKEPHPCGMKRWRDRSAYLAVLPLFFPMKQVEILFEPNVRVTTWEQQLKTPELSCLCSFS